MVCNYSLSSQSRNDGLTCGQSTLSLLRSQTPKNSHIIEVRHFTLNTFTENGHSCCLRRSFLLSLLHCCRIYPLPPTREGWWEWFAKNVIFFSLNLFAKLIGATEILSADTANPSHPPPQQYRKKAFANNALSEQSLPHTHLTPPLPHPSIRMLLFFVIEKENNFSSSCAFHDSTEFITLP